MTRAVSAEAIAREAVARTGMSDPPPELLAAALIAMVQEERATAFARAAPRAPTAPLKLDEEPPL